MFSELFIKRPILATVCSLMIILAGAIAIPTLPIARYPDLTPPSVDDSTQTVLVKTPLTPKGTLFRTEQFVRAHIVFSTVPGLTVPVVALSRINGQYFAFVAEPGEGGATVAKQKSVQVGQVIGNDYVLLGGLKAGDKLIVSGIQKIGDGAPVTAMPAASAPKPGTGEGAKPGTGEGAKPASGAGS